MSTKESRRIRHILVALDASPHSLAALAAAAEVARELKAELTGLFVEDVNLLKLAQLPFAQQIHFPRATAQKLNTPLVEKQLHAQAILARENLRHVAETAAVGWSFRVARGSVASELLAAALEADLLVLGRLSHRLAQAHGVGSTAQTAVTHSRQPVLLLGVGFNLNLPVLAFYDGATAAQTAMNLAAELAQASGQLRLLIWANDDEDAARQFQHDAIARLADCNLILSFRNLLNHENIVQIIQGAGAGLFVIGDSGLHFTQQIIQTTLAQTDLPLLVVR